MSTLGTSGYAAPPLQEVVVPPSPVNGPRANTPDAEIGRLIEGPGCATGWGVIDKIASGREELTAAFGLVYKAYLQAGLSTRHPYQMRVTPYHLLPTTEVFIALQEGEVIGTMSLVRDGELGLPMEAVYGEEVAKRRKRYHLGEVSCLADHRKGQRRSVPVVLSLMSLMAQCAKSRGVDQLMIAVHPRHAKFYQRFAAFEPIGELKSYGAVCDNPAVAMSLDLNWAPIDHPRLYEKFFARPYPDEVLKHRSMTEELRAELSHVIEANCAGQPCSELEVLGAW